MIARWMTWQDFPLKRKLYLRNQWVLYSVTVLVCALYFVVTHPEVEGKLYDEIKSVLGDKDVDGSSVDQLV